MAAHFGFHCVSGGQRPQKWPFQRFLINFKKIIIKIGQKFLCRNRFSKLGVRLGREITKSASAKGKGRKVLPAKAFLPLPLADADFRISRPVEHPTLKIDCDTKFLTDLIIFLK